MSSLRSDRVERGLTLLAVTLGLVIVSLDNTVVQVANPAIGRDLHASLGDLQWLTNAYLLALAVGVLPGGKLGDRFGRKRIFVIGATGFTLASAACGLSGSLAQLVGFRVAQGLFGPCFLPQTLALLRATFPRDRLAEVVGIWTGATAVASGAGPLIGGVLVEQFSWHAIFFVNVPVGAVCVVVAVWVVTESRDMSSGPELDVAGLLLLAGGLSALVWGLIQTESHGWLVSGGLPFLLAAAVLLIAFVQREASAGVPLIPLDIFRSRELSAGVVLALLGSLCQSAACVRRALSLERLQGLSPAQAGARMLALTGAEIVAGPLGGRLADRVGPRLPLTVAFVGMAMSLAALSQLGPASSYLLIGPALAAVGLGIGIMGSAASACVVGNAPRDRAGVASGIQVTAFQVGAVLGTSALGSVVAARVSAVFPADLIAAGLPAHLFHPLGPASRAVSEALVPTAAGHSIALAPLRQASFAAFTDGLDVAFAVAAVIAVLCAALSYVGTSQGARANDAEELDHFPADLVPATAVISVAVPDPD